MTDASNLQVIVLEGAPRVRGQIHGESLREGVREFVALWKDGISKLGDDPTEDRLDSLLGRTGLVPAVRRWTPDLLEEVEGLAEGAGIGFSNAFAIQLLEEPNWFPHFLQNSVQTAAPTHHCSTIGVFAQRRHPALLAQNWDSSVWFHGRQLVSHIKDPQTGVESFVVGAPGIIGPFGLSSRGVGVCMNHIATQVNYSPEGLGLTFMGRALLGKQSFEDAVRFLQTVRHSVGQAVTVGGPERIRVFEVSGNKAAEYAPYQGATRVYHTNHVLASDDLWLFGPNLGRAPAEVQEKMRLLMPNTTGRLETIKRRLASVEEPVTVDTIKAILSSHDLPEAPLCNHRLEGRPGMTVACFIMTLSRDAPEMEIAPGPPCMTGFTTLRF